MRRLRMCHVRTIRRFVLLPVLLMAGLSAVSGCDAVYRLLQKEGAEEKDLLGTISPLEPNARVEEVQKLLKLYGYKIGRPDGILGANTRQAIGDFQKDRGLPVTRFVDYKTWDELTRFD